MFSYVKDKDCDFICTSEFMGIVLPLFKDFCTCSHQN